MSRRPLPSALSQLRQRQCHAVLISRMAGTYGGRVYKACHGDGSPITQSSGGHKGGCGCRPLYLPSEKRKGQRLHQRIIAVRHLEQTEQQQNCKDDVELFHIVCQFKFIHWKQVILSLHNIPNSFYCYIYSMPHFSSNSSLVFCIHSGSFFRA